MTRSTVDIEDDIAWVTLDGVRRRNALDAEFWAQFGASLDAVVAARPGAIVLTGAGDVFCAGGDVARMRESLAAMRDGAFELPERERMERIDALLIRWAAFPVPKISAINGPAVGAGLGLAASCDYSVVAESAFFDTAFARLGLPGDMGVTHYLPRAIGERPATQWLLRARRVDPSEAVRIGLADEAVPRRDLRRRAGEVAREFAAGSRSAAASILQRSSELRALQAALDREREATIAAKQTPFHREAVERFFAPAASTSTSPATSPSTPSPKRG